jgi:hypothetical protein
MDPISMKLRVGVLITVMGTAFLVWASAGVSPGSASVVSNPKAKYSEFHHDTKAHRFDCGTCHKFPSSNWKQVRDEKAAFPDITDYPKHESCLRCHMQQFFRGARPAICSNCHTNPGPRGGNRFPYPNPRELFDKSPKAVGHESDFVVAFPHDKHIDIVSQAAHDTRFVNASYTRRLAEESCAVCHQTMAPQDKSEEEFFTKPPPKWGDAFWLKKGTFKTAPTGHTVCFTCHTAETGIMPTGDKCASCHTLKPKQPPADFDPAAARTMGVTDKVMLDAWKNRHSAGRFRHEWFSHAEAACATCHSVATMNTADPVTTRVAVSSCATCHATPTSDDGGALNFEIDSRKADPKFQCTKCHVVFGRSAIPDSHTKALAAATAK